MGSNGASAATVADVLARYDELAALVASIAGRPLADAALTPLAAAALHREARLLDARRLDDWLGWFAPDAVVWVPIADEPHPATDQSLYLDDRRRLAERVAWHDQPTAWGQHPASTTVRTVGSVEAWPTTDGLVAHSTVTLLEQRKGATQLVLARQVHELVGPDLRCRSKVLLVPQLADGLRNPSFLL
jgi:3-phenylpropionate/cinnamic acid dioxygenase small subunit